MTELKPCPSCGFDTAEWQAHRQRMGFACAAVETYLPHVVEMLGQQFIECQNCGFTVAWPNTVSNATAQMWNELPRKRGHRD